MRRWLLQSQRSIFTTAVGDEFHHRDGAMVALQRRAQLRDMIQGMPQHCEQEAYAKLLWTCTDLRALQEGIRVHRHIVDHGLAHDSFLATCLVTMYGKCRRVEEARVVFDGMPSRSVFSWTAMITAFAQNGHHAEALALFERMDVAPNSVTLLTCVTACCEPRFLEIGKKLHSEIGKRGFDRLLNVANVLLNMYSRCGSMEEAERYFGGMQQRNAISWSTMMSGYAQRGNCWMALTMFRSLLQEGEAVCSVTYLTILNACTSSRSLDVGKWIHSCIVESGHLVNMPVGSALVSMYARCQSFQDAKRTFDGLRDRNVVIWTSMITACSQYEECSQALELYHRMQLDGVLPNEVTFASVINSCATLLALEPGRRIHRILLESAVFRPGLALENALIDLYGKCRELDEAFRIFEAMETRNVLTWTSMLASCAYNGYHSKAIYLYKCMLREGFKLDKWCYTSVIVACSSSSNLTEGRRICSQIVESGYHADIVVSNAVIDMYSKCGCPGRALSVFQDMPAHDAITWNALMASFAQHGYGEEVPKLFSKMQQDGAKPDEVTVVTLLSACSHAGLVEQGCDYFVSIEGEYRTSQSYGCMVDLLARAGHLVEAENFVSRMPEGLDRTTSWMAILSACRVYSDAERGRRASQVLAKLLPEGSSPHVVLSNMYSEKKSSVGASLFDLKTGHHTKHPGMWTTVHSSTQAATVPASEVRL